MKLVTLHGQQAQVKTQNSVQRWLARPVITRTARVQHGLMMQEKSRAAWWTWSEMNPAYRSAYRAFFVGSVGFEPWKRLWKSWAPSKCKTFVWLAIRNRCWTADRLQKRGLPHPVRCPLCDQEEETNPTFAHLDVCLAPSQICGRSLGRNCRDNYERDLILL